MASYVSRSARQFMERIGEAPVSRQQQSRLDVDSILVRHVPVLPPAPPTYLVAGLFAGDPPPDNAGIEAWPPFNDEA